MKEKVGAPEPNRASKLSRWWTLVRATAVSAGLALIAGVVGAIAAMYLYDPHDQTKGSGFVVGMAGLFAAGIFTFVVTFTYFRRRHYKMSPRAPAFIWLVSLIVPAVFTVLMWDNGYDYANLILAGWFGVLLSGLGAVSLSRRLLLRAAKSEARSL